MKWTLPQAVYEALRWILTIVVPASMTLLSLLSGAWGWDLPLDAILTTMSGVAAFVGVIFGISKLNNDYNEDN